MSLTKYEVQRRHDKAGLYSTAEEAFQQLNEETDVGIRRESTFDEELLYSGFQPSGKMSLDEETQYLQYAWQNGTRCSKSWYQTPKNLVMVKLPNLSVIEQFHNNFEYAIVKRDFPAFTDYDKNDYAQFFGFFIEATLAQILQEGNTITFAHGQPGRTLSEPFEISDKDTITAIKTELDGMYKHPGRRHFVQTLHYSPDFHGVPMLILEDFDGLLSEITSKHQENLIQRAGRWYRTKYHKIEEPNNKLDNFDWFTIAQHICSGLQYMHSKGVVHGNIQASSVAYCVDSAGKYTYKLTNLSSGYFGLDDENWQFQTHKDMKDAAILIADMARKLELPFVEYDKVLFIDVTLRMDQQGAGNEIQKNTEEMQKMRAALPQLHRIAYDYCFCISHLQRYPVNDTAVDTTEKLFSILLRILDVTDHPSTTWTTSVRALKKAMQDVYDNYAMIPKLLSTGVSLTDVSLSHSMFEFQLALYRALRYRNASSGHKVLQEAKALMMALLTSRTLMVAIPLQLPPILLRRYIQTEFTQPVSILDQQGKIPLTREVIPQPLIDYSALFKQHADAQVETEDYV